MRWRRKGSGLERQDMGGIRGTEEGEEQEEKEGEDGELNTKEILFPGPRMAAPLSLGHSLTRICTHTPRPHLSSSSLPSSHMNSLSFLLSCPDSRDSFLFHWVSPSLGPSPSPGAGLSPPNPHLRRPLFANPCLGVLESLKHKNLPREKEVQARSPHRLMGSPC